VACLLDTVTPEIGPMHPKDSKEIIATWDFMRRIKHRIASFIDKYGTAQILFCYAYRLQLTTRIIGRAIFTIRKQ
jgi:hypothetical protein